MISNYKTNNAFYGERLYEKELSTNVKCFIIKKKDYKQKQAMVAVNYGSADSCFLTDKKAYCMPGGIAHFLEHKMFEDKSLNMFEEFSKHGASANAYTNLNNTAYYFSCNENFIQNLKLLLRLVSNPYFTEENVEKEKGIIEQEINMYKDDAMWQVYFNLLNGLYLEHPLRKNIAGEVSDIQKITVQMLYDCYDTFYTSKNIVIICVGDFNEKEVCETIQENLKLKPSSKFQKDHGSESENINQAYIEKRMTVERKLFNIGIKDIDFNKSAVQKICETNILLDIIAGRSSDLFTQLYKKGLADNSFSCDYNSGTDYGFSILSGFSDKPEYIAELFFKELEMLKAIGIKPSSLKRIKKKHLSRFIRSFDSIDSIANICVDFFTKGITFSQYIDCLKNITAEDIQQRLNEHFSKERTSISVITPNM